MHIIYEEKCKKFKMLNKKLHTKNIFLIFARYKQSNQWLTSTTSFT